jgi:N-formylglutamate deformylase
MDVFQLHRGDAPLLISLPHDGTAVPDALRERFTDEAARVPDTDWHVARLYAFARELGASILVPAYSRYVVDLNRPPDDMSLYPGQNTTGLCPVTTFAGTPVYRAGATPDANEVAERVAQYWRPYHDALHGEIDRLHRVHGRVVLWEGHSIRGECPFLFDGSLPDFNLGTAAGQSCSPALEQRLERVLAAQTTYSWVANGRFKGGYITRRYGEPAKRIEAVQLELAQRNYMDEDSFVYLEDRAAPTAALIRSLLEVALRDPVAVPA